MMASKLEFCESGKRQDCREWLAKSLVRPQNFWLFRHSARNQFEIFFPASLQGPADSAALAEETLQDAIDFCNESESHPSLVSKIAEIYDLAKLVPDDNEEAGKALADSNTSPNDHEYNDGILSTIWWICMPFAVLALLIWLYR